MGIQMKQNVHLPYGKHLPSPAYAEKHSFPEAAKADVKLIIGNNAEVLHAADIPVKAKEHGAKIIEINIEPSHY